MSGFNMNVNPGVPLGTFVWGGSQSAAITNVPTMVAPPEPIYTEPLALPYVGGYAYRSVPKITGIQNVANPYGNLPRVYGTYRMRPPLAAQFVNVVQNGVTYAMGLFCLGYGPLDISDIKIGDKAIGTIPGCKYEVLPGADPDTEKITIFNPDFKDLNVNSALKYNVQAKRTAPQSAVELQVDIRFPNGLAQFDASGNRTTATVQIRVEYSSNGTTWTNVPPENGLSTDPALTETNNTTADYSRSIIWTVTKGTYQVRVTRLTADSTDSTLKNETVWTTLRAFNDTPSYNPILDKSGNKIGLAFIAVKIKASDTANGQLSDLNCIAKSKLSAYSGVSWGAAAITNNPAWIFADIITGTANIKARPKADLDAAQLKEWADFCVAEGLTFNYIFDGGSTVMEALKLVAAAGRASVAQNDGKFSVVIDRKQTTAAQHFTPRNCHSITDEGRFPEPPHAMVMRFVNKSSTPDYQSDERVVYWDGYTSDGRNGTSIATLRESHDLIGVTDADQAWKLGRYYLAVGYLRRRKISLVTDVEGLRCQRFNMVRVGSDTLRFGQGQGLIKSVATNGSGDVVSVTIDETVTMDATKQYGVWFRLADMSERHERIVTVAGAGSTFTLQTPIPAATSPKPAVGDMVMFGEYGRECVEMLVTGIEMLDEKSARITCIDHAPGVFDAVSGTIPAFDSGTSTATPYPQELVPTPVIVGYRTDEQVLLRDTDGSLQARIQLTMEPPPANVQYWEVQMKLSSSTQYGAPQIFSVNSGEVYLSPVIENQTYDIQVKAVTYSSKRSLTPAELLGVKVIGKQTPPPDVPSLAVQNNYLTWLWDAASLGQDVPKDFAGFRIKWVNGSAPNWELGTVAADLIVGTQFSLETFPKGLLTIMVKAVDTAGNESTNAAILVRHFGDYQVSNSLWTFNHDPNFTFGTITNGTVSGGVIQANDDGGLMYSADDNALMYQADDSALMYQTNWLEMSYEWRRPFDPQYFPTGTEPPYYVLDLFQQAEYPTIEFRTGGDSIFYGPNDDNLPMYGSDDNALFYDPDPPYRPWPGRWQASYDTLYMRAKCSASRRVLGKIGPLQEILDAIDISENIDDAPIAIDGTRLSLSKVYRAVKNVRSTWQQQPGESGPYHATAVDKSTSGPLMKMYDAAGASVAGVIDATVVGY